MLDAVLDFIVIQYSKSSIDYCDLKNIVYYCDNKAVVVELGTNVGTTTEALAHCRIGSVSTVDVFEDVEKLEEGFWKSRYIESFKNNKHTFESIKARLSKYGNVNVIKCLTAEASKSFIDSSVDVLFIDADHSYEGVKKDFNSWFDKVVEKGVILLHDVVDNGNFKGLYSFYKELKSDFRLIELPVTQPTSVRAFRKERS